MFNSKMMNRGRPKELPWKEWFSQREFTIPWVTYGPRLLLMAQQVRNEATKRGVGVSIRTEGHDLVVQVRAIVLKNNKK